jgi:preprotein translocase subunit SecF
MKDGRCTAILPNNVMKAQRNGQKSCHQEDLFLTHRAWRKNLQRMTKTTEHHSKQKQQNAIQNKTTEHNSQQKQQNIIQNKNNRTPFKTKQQNTIHNKNIITPFTSRELQTHPNTDLSG